jgi:hypothetical protein
MNARVVIRVVLDTLNVMDVYSSFKPGAMGSSGAGDLMMKPVPLSSLLASSLGGEESVPRWQTLRQRLL